RVDVTAAAPSPTDPAPFSGDFVVDLITTANARNRLTANDVRLNRIDINQALTATLTATARIDLGLKTDYFANNTPATNFPDIQADFHLDWAFDPNAANAADRGLAGGVPHIVFHDIRLNLGTFLSKFITPFVTAIDNVLQPIKPIVDFLEKPLPVISQFEGFSDEQVHAGQGVKLLGLVSQL